MSVLGIHLNWTVTGRDSGDDTLRRMSYAFERAGAELAQPGRFIFPRMMLVIQRAEKRQFEAQGQGQAWAPLSPRYSKWKTQHYPGQPIGVRTNALRWALTNSGSRYALRDYTSTEMSFGTSALPYASLFSGGTARMPARPLFDFEPDRAFQEEAESAAINGARAAFRAAKLDEFVEGPDAGHDEPNLPPGSA